jgi:hypothetical protein
MASYFIDPAGGDDGTGDGTVGNPWKTIQHALDTVTQGANGDKFNIKAGGNAKPASELSFSTYGTVSTTQPVVFAGYNTSESDGGQATIDFEHATYPFINNNAEGFFVCNIDFLNNKNDGSPIFSFPGVLRFRRASGINNCRFIDCIRGYTSGGSGFVAISNCEFIRVERPVYSDDDRVNITNSLFSECGTAIIPVLLRVTSVVNCIFEKCGGVAVNSTTQATSGPFTQCSFLDCVNGVSMASGVLDHCYFEGCITAVNHNFDRGGVVFSCAFFDNGTDISAQSSLTQIGNLFLSSSGLENVAGGDYTPKSSIVSQFNYQGLPNTTYARAIGAVPASVGVIGPSRKFHPLGSNPLHPLGG